MTRRRYHRSNTAQAYCRLPASLWRVNLGETGGGDQNGMRRPIA
jgi:hypothetical protein